MPYKSPRFQSDCKYNGYYEERNESQFCIQIKHEPGIYRKSRLKAHGFNRGMKGGVARHPLLGMIRATNLLDNRMYERYSSHW
jgi:hypothetical protein